MNNIAIIMGRGIEGCGVTKFTLEQIKWLKANGYNCKAFASKEKKWSHRNVHNYDAISEINFSDPINIQTIVDACNASDVVIINSLPSKGHNQESIDAFAKILDSIQSPIVFVQHDHSVLSINRNRCMKEAVQKSSVIFSHSRTNDFAEEVKKITGSGGLSTLFGDDEDDGKEVLNFQPGLDFDVIRKKYWKPIEEQDDIHNKWIGRTTSWKGYQEMFKFHDNYLRPGNFLTTMEGVEKGFAFIPFKSFKYGEWEGDAYRINEIEKWDLKPGNRMYLFGPYHNEDMLERMSKVAFGYQLALLKPRFIERSIEYGHCEVVCSGTMPVFREAYGKSCIHRKTGDPLIESKDNGTIWLPDDVKSMQRAYEQIQFFSANPTARDEMREKAYEFYKSHQDAQYTFDEMMRQIKSNLT